MGKRRDAGIENVLSCIDQARACTDAALSDGSDYIGGVTIGVRPAAIGL